MYKTIRTYKLNIKKIKIANNADYNGSLRFKKDMCLDVAEVKAVMSEFMRDARRLIGD